MESLLELLKKTETFFEKKGIEKPRLEAELLFAHALGLKRLDLYLQYDRPMTEELMDKVRPLVARRGKREPLQYILGKHEFYDLQLKVDRRALIPRQETEELVELLCQRIKEPVKVLDMGTGTGAIALALAKNLPEGSEVTAVDLSKDALALAKENADALGLADKVTFLRSDWFTSLSGEFDLIVSNPPYLTDAEMESAAPEVIEYEPHEALLGKEGGAGDLAEIIQEAKKFLKKGGLLALETGIAQHDHLTAIATQVGFTNIESVKDMSGRERFLVLGDLGCRL